MSIVNCHLSNAQIKLVNKANKVITSYNFLSALYKRDMKCSTPPTTSHLFKHFFTYFLKKTSLTKMAQKSKVLVIGGTGYIGKFVVEASAKAGHPTYALVRDETLSNPAKAPIIDNFKSLGVNLVAVCYT